MSKTTKTESKWMVGLGLAVMFLCGYVVSDLATNISHDEGDNRRGANYERKAFQDNNDNPTRRNYRSPRSNNPNNHNDNRG